MFLRDSQHALLQSRLHLEQIHKICVLQRWVKGALQRKQFIRQKNAAVMIQVRTENGGVPLSTMDLWTFGSECKGSQNSSSPLSPLKKKMRARHSHWTHLRVPFLIEGRCLEIFSRNFLKIFMVIVKLVSSKVRVSLSETFIEHFDFTSGLLAWLLSS